MRGRLPRGRPLQLRRTTGYPPGASRDHRQLPRGDDRIRHLRQFDEPRAQALFETGAEVPGGPRTVFLHGERAEETTKHEPAGHYFFTGSSRDRSAGISRPPRC